jgi:hypothetical protein
MTEQYQKIFAILIFLSYFCWLFSPTVIFAADDQGQTYKEQTFVLNVPIGELKTFNISQSSNNILGDYIKAWYGFLIGTVGIIAAVMIMYGGIKFLASRGDNTQISNARETIISAITGLVLAFGSYTILSIVSPNLLTIHVPALPRIQDTSGIDMTKQQASVGSQEKSANSSTGAGGGTFSGDGLKPQAQKLLSDLPGAQLSSDPIRNDPGSNHDTAIAEAIDVRATPEMTAFADSLINNGKYSKKYLDTKWGMVYEFQNFTINGHTYPIVRLIDERGVHPIFHWDLGKH